MVSQYHVFLGNYVFTIAVSIIMTLAFESPIVIIEKIIFGGGKRPEQSNGATNGVTTKPLPEKECA